LGEESSIAAAYALDRVLKAVIDVGSASVLRDVEDLPIVAGDGDDWIWRDSLGRFGEDCVGSVIVVACWLMMASII
jgi:hypothetical protein